MSTKSISILGVEITSEHFPNLYWRAEHDTEWLSGQLQKLAGAAGGTIQNAAISLEHDLEHEKRIADMHPLSDNDLTELADFFDLLAQFDHEDRNKE